MPILAELSPSVPREVGDRGEASDELLELLTDALQHEARNPLNVLSIHLEVLAERLRLEAGASLPPAVEKSLKAMREQIGRVDQLLAWFGEFAAPKAEPAGPIDLSALVGRAIELLGHLARRRRVQLRAALEPGVRASAADPRRLRRQVLEPIAQAIDASGDGGEVIVAVNAERRQAVFRVEEGGRPRGAVELYLPLE